MTSVISQDIVVQGKPARVWRGGSGDPLVLLHGGLGDAEFHWRANFEALAQSHDVIAPDLPGFGASAAIPQPSYQAYLNWLQHLFETHHLLDQLRIVGNSFGGALARLYAAAHPDEVRQLVLVDGGIIREAPGCAQPLFRIPGLSSLLLEQVRRRAYSPQALKSYIYDEWRIPVDYIERAQQASYGFVASMRQAALTMPPTLRTPTCPTLVVWGEADTLSSPEAGRTLAQSIPHAQFELIKKAGHLPQLEQADLFNDLILNFLSNPHPATVLK